MSFLNRYIAYIKNNPERHWFKRKAYGWGWVPAMWEGWAVLAAYVAVLVGFVVVFLSMTEPSERSIVWFLISVAGWAIALIFTCYSTGERPKWQWGIPEKKIGSQ